MRIRVLTVLAVCLVVCGASSASEPPRNLMAHIRVKSLEGLLERLDDFAVAATRNTRNAVPEGGLTMLSAIMLPVPLDVVRAEGDAHVLLFSHGPRTEFVIVVGTEDFDAMIDAIASRMSLEEVDDAAPFVALHRGYGFEVARLADGRAAFILATQSGPGVGPLDWVGTYAGDALVNVRLPLHSENIKMVVDSFTRFRSEFARARPEALAALRTYHIAPDLADGVLDLAEEYAPRLFDALTALQAVEIDIDVDGDRLVAAASAQTAAGSALHEFALRLSRRDDVDSERFARGPIDAYSVGVVAAPDAYVPREQVAEVHDVVFGRLFPDLRDRALALTHSIYDAIGKQSVVASYVSSEGRPYSATIYRPDDADRFLSLFRDGIALQNDVAQRLFDDERYGFRFVAEADSAAQAGFEKYRIELADPAAMEALLASVMQSAAIPESNLDFGYIRDFRLYLGQVGDEVVVVSGLVADGDIPPLVESIRDAAASAGKNEAARRAAADLRDSQGAAALVSAGGFVPAVTAQAVRTLTTSGVDRSERLLELAAENFSDSGEYFALSFGAADGVLRVRGVFPVAGVNAVVRDFEALSRAQIQMRYEAQQKEDGAAGDDAYDNEMEGEDDEEADMLLDAPAEAS